MTNEMLLERLSKLDSTTAKKIMKKMLIGLITNPALFAGEGKDEEQLAWFEKELKKLGK